MSGLDGRLPFSVEDANRPETEIASTEEVQYKRVLLDTRLDNRVIDLRVCAVCAGIPTPEVNSRIDPNESSCIQIAACYRPLIPGILGFSGIH